jgi:hypothetical protein
MTTRIRPVTVLDEDEEESVQSQSIDVGSQPATVDRLMESFTQELDSMEQGPDLHEMIERAKSRAEESYNNNYNNSSANTGRGGVPEAYQQQQQQQQQHAADPYDYANRSRPTEDYRDTPDMRMRRTEGTASSTPDSRRPIQMTTTTTTPQEPKPVRTPPYQRYSPLAATVPVGYSYSTRLEGAALDPERGRYESSSRRPPVNMQSPTNGYSKMQSPTPNGSTLGLKVILIQNVRGGLLGE